MILKGPFIQSMTDEQFASLCHDNDSLRIERLANHQILIEKKSSLFEDDVFRSVAHQLLHWNKQHNLGSVLTRKYFRLPSGAVRHAPIAWVSTKQLVTTVIADHGMNMLCPDFVVDFRSHHYNLKTSKGKMKEWIDNGCRLGWLIDEKKKVIYIFEQSKVRKSIGLDKTLTEQSVLPGLTFDLCRFRSQQANAP